MLRAVSNKDKDVDHDIKENIAALNVTNGDIQVEESFSNSILKEESKFKVDGPTPLLEGNKIVNEELKYNQQFVDKDVDKSTKSSSKPDIEEKPCSPQGLNKDREAMPDSVNKPSNSTNRNSDNALSRIESLLDDEFEEVRDTYNEDLIEEIVRKCDHFEGQPLPQNLVKSVVSLTTPKDVLSTTPLEPPGFVEFSMAEDGFGCLFIPSLNPQPVSSK